MRLPRVRFTVRRLLVLIAIGALIFATFPEVDRRRQRLRALRMEYASRAMSTDDHRLASYYGELSAKYYHAAKSPYLPVWPDPPAPK
jgi:hypothetical protein